MTVEERKRPRARQSQRGTDPTHSATGSTCIQRKATKTDVTPRWRPASVMTVNLSMPNRFSDSPRSEVDCYAS